MCKTFGDKVIGLITKLHYPDRLPDGSGDYPFMDNLKQWRLWSNFIVSITQTTIKENL